MIPHDGEVIAEDPAGGGAAMLIIRIRPKEDPDSQPASRRSGSRQRVSFRATLRVLRGPAQSAACRPQIRWCP